MKRILSISGGKDSTAMYLLALEHGRAFESVFADTGNEHQETLDYVRALPRLTGGPEIRWVKADFVDAIARKRAFIAKQWAADGVPHRQVERAIAACQPTGIPFLDLCLLKGRFPSVRARFCTQELKIFPIFYQVIAPALAGIAHVVSWQGVRADESRARALLPVRERQMEGHRIFRPLLKWSVADVFNIHRRHGVKPNPLYQRGCRRVGCMPCIHESKAGIANVVARWPEHIDRIAEWEWLIARASKRGMASFFSSDKTPGDHQGRADVPAPGIRAVADWAKTSRGGRQYDLEAALPPAPCASVYGLCE